MRRSPTSLALGALAACAPAPAHPVRPPCPTDRDVVVARQAELAQLAGCTAVHGLTIRSGATLDTSALAALAEITSDLVVGPTIGVEDISLPGLRRIGGTLHVAGNGLMQGVFLRALEHAGRIEITGNPVLTTIGLPSLTVVDGALRVTDNASLELLDLAALATIGQLAVVTGAPRLNVLDAPRLPAEVVDQMRASAAR